MLPHGVRRVLLIAFWCCCAIPAFGLQRGDRIKAESTGINVRNATLTTVLFIQVGGVHGTITSDSVQGSAGGYTGRWWRIRWDSQPPSQGSTEGWSAESVLSVAPTAGDIPPRDLSSAHYTTANIFYPEHAPGNLGTAVGNCTWYAHGRMRELGYDPAQLNAMSGNASQWDNQARGKGIRVDGVPHPGAIAQTNQYANGLGHVAVVESVNDDGTITVTESSFVTSPDSAWNILWRHRTVDASWFENFIHVDAGSGSPVDRDISILANATQHVRWFYFATGKPAKWYIVANDFSSNPSVLLLKSVEYAGIRWKPISNAQAPGFAGAGTRYSFVTVSSDGRTISFGSLATFLELDPDVRALANTTQTVAWFYITTGNAWYIVSADRSSNASVLLLQSFDPTIAGGIRWKPINNYGAYAGFAAAGTNYTYVQPSADGRSVVFGATR